MYDFDLLPGDTVFAIEVALALFAIAFVSFAAISIYTLIKTTLYQKKNEDKITLMCDVAYFHERGKSGNQEDSVDISPLDQLVQHGLVAACSDGMGGLLNGEVVSKYVTDTLNKRYPLDFNDQAGITKMITEISDKVYEDYHLSAGATLVMVHIMDDLLNFYNLGDSNIILIRNNRATLLNNKQNYAAVMIKKFSEGGIDTVDAYKDSRAKGLTDFVGNHKCNVQMTKRPMKLRDNDIIIVGSDGVTDSMPLNRIVSHIHPDQNATGIARMIKYGVKASKNPRQDNYSAMIIKLRRSTV